jgi:hypothetical protein
MLANGTTSVTLLMRIAITSLPCIDATLAGKCREQLENCF